MTPVRPPINPLKFKILPITPLFLGAYTNPRRNSFVFKIHISGGLNAS